MNNYNIVDIAKTDLFSAQDELDSKKYPPIIVAKVLRLRDMYNWFLANPEKADRDFVRTDVERYKLSKITAYEDLKIIKLLLPELGNNSRDFHRWRYNEMILETYKMAKIRKDTKTMEKAASSYAKYNRIDSEEMLAIPYDKILVQPFTATSDPTVLGIKPMPNLRDEIRRMTEKYMAETIDIQDVDFEEVDLEEEELWGDTPVPLADDIDGEEKDIL